MDRRYVDEMTKPFWDRLYRLKLIKGRITLDNIINQVQRDFGIHVTRKEILEVLFKDSSAKRGLKVGLVEKNDRSTSTIRPKRPSSAPHPCKRQNRPQFDRRIQVPQYRPITPMYRAKWTADKLETIENNQRSYYRNRRAHYKHVRRIRKPSLRPYPGGGTPKQPTYCVYKGTFSVR